MMPDYQSLMSRVTCVGCGLTLLLLTLSMLVSAETIPDPTRPSGFQNRVTSPAAEYRLESILLGANRKVAIINGKSYNEGERTELGTLAQISKDSVVIQGKQRHVLKLLTQSIKQPPEKP